MQLAGADSDAEVAFDAQEFRQQVRDSASLVGVGRDVDSRDDNLAVAPARQLPEAPHGVVPVTGSLPSAACGTMQNEQKLSQPS